VTDPAVDGANDLAANRWGLRGKKGKSLQDNPLIAGFGRLRHDLTGVKGMEVHDAPLERLGDEKRGVESC